MASIDRSIDRSLQKSKTAITKPEHTNNQTIDLYHTMAPRDKELKRLKEKTRRDNKRDEKNQMIEKVEKAKESNRKSSKKYNAKQRLSKPFQWNESSGGRFPSDSPRALSLAGSS
jgi:transketolase